MRSNLIFTLCFLSLGVSAQTEYIVFAECRYDNNKTLDWDRENGYVFTYRDQSPCRTMALEKETYYPKVKGTELILYLDSSRFDRNETITIHGSLTTTHFRTGTRIFSDRDYAISLKDLQPIDLSHHVYKLQKPLDVGEPELFSLVTMMNAIQKDLFQSGNKQNHFPDALRTLNRLEHSEFFRDISFDDLMDYFRLCDYLKEYAEDNSFFNDEAAKLKRTIDRNNKQLMDSMAGTSKTDSNTRITQEMINENIVYQEYLNVSATIREAYAKLKILLYYRMNR